MLEGRTRIAPVDVEKYVRDGLAWVASHPPSYSFR